MPDRPSCDPGVLRHLLAEVRNHPGGHQPQVQTDLGKLTTTTARWLLHTLRDQRYTITRARAQPWRKV